MIDPQNDRNKLLYILTYGCQMNENDSERMAGQLQSIGYGITNDVAEADLIIINTCCIRESAEKKIYGKIGELKRYKTLNPRVIIGVTGCMAQKEQEKLIKKAPHLDFVLGTNNIGSIVEVVNKLEVTKQPIIDTTEDNLIMGGPAVRENKISAWVPITYGCNNFCTYCIVPYVRGREKSRDPEEILQEIKKLGNEGYKEITLLGQNVNSYGKDCNEYGDFAELLHKADRLNAVSRIRFMTSHPRDMNDKVIDVISNGTSICEHFHLPIQAGSNKILQAMNRGYSVEYYYDLVDKIRTKIPNASITTDIIVGFPGETEELFEETLNVIKTVNFDAAYTFIYSKRSGTLAAKMENQVELSVKKERLNRLMSIQNMISLAINKRMEGQVVEVLVEGESKNDKTKYTGRTRTNKIVIFDKVNILKTGQLVNVKIDKAQTWLLKGTLTD